ncbi:PEP-CTERM sorting domain-containing protein [Haloferula sp. A504]|uniref:PEP-CTERM sorting domain-containing protein n=1 Tax=Haloferula sp. A504 TaxID=3373601 RepID=UPI0031C66D22|nr:PEP-CTERM sorting domain-containing protein [Verrucomicrobiaceae bacterium E54]
MKSKLITFTVALVASTAVSQAATIVPTGYTHASGNAGPESNAGNDTTSPIRMIDNVISTGGWSDGTNVSWGQGTITATNPTAGMTFIFDQVYDFSTINIYQNEGGGWGATDYRISTSTDNSDFSNTTGILDLPTGSAVSGTASTILYTLDVSSLNDAKYVQVELFNANQWVMLSEVDFDGAAVPEPSTALLGALALLALLRRRRA